MKDQNFEVIVAGFGGQGVLFAGNLLAQAAMEEGFNVTYLPEYGPEMRGGTCHCTVVISKGEIASPVVNKVKGAIFLNFPSFQKFLPRLIKKGYMVVNTSLIPKEFLPGANGFRVAALPLQELAQKIGSDRLINLIALGAFVRLTRIVSPENLLKSLKKVLPGRYRDLLPANQLAFKLGLSFASD